MTVMTTTFIPCSAKLPIIALIAGAIFHNSGWVATSAYFIGIAAIIVSGIMLKKTKAFAGDPAPFVMELPAYHWPRVSDVLRSVWERASHFIKKAGTIILLSTIVIWFLQGFGVEGGSFGMVDNMDHSILAVVGRAIAWLFVPLGWGTWRPAVAAITGLVAKENVVGTFGILYHHASDAEAGNAALWAAIAKDYTSVSAFSFMVFNLLCAPCFAAIGAIKGEMGNAKWTWGAIGYQCGLAYLVSMAVYQIGGLVSGEVGFNFWTVIGIAVVVGICYMLFRPDPNKQLLDAARAEA
jgi:ferrous iron transport protein B